MTLQFGMSSNGHRINFNHIVPLSPNREQVFISVATANFQSWWLFLAVVKLVKKKI